MCSSLMLTSGYGLQSEFSGCVSPGFKQHGQLLHGSWKKSRVSAAYGTGRAAAFPFKKVGECLLYASPAAKRKKPKAILQFLGGAFIGAAPEITYSYLIELLAREGFLIVAAPYNVTFDHEVSARQIHRKWSESLDLLSSSGCSSFGLTPKDVLDIPRISVGHSNGALMQVLIGSYCKDEKLPQANAVISFNNKPAADAVPLFDQQWTCFQLGPSLTQLQALAQASPINAFAKYLTEEAIKGILDPPFPLPPGIERENLDSIRRFVQQIPSVFGQVADGISEFRPTPQQNRDNISISYAVPHNLLVKFSVDALDETDVLEELLRPQISKIGGSLTKLVLNGTHLTPLAPDINVQVGDVYTPADAINQALRKAALADLENLARKISGWVETLKADSLL